MPPYINPINPPPPPPSSPRHPSTQEIDAHVASGYLQLRTVLHAQFNSPISFIILCVEYRLAMLLEALVNIEYTKYLAKLSIRMGSTDSSGCEGKSVGLHASQPSTMSSGDTTSRDDVTASFSEEEQQTYALFSSCNVEASRYLQHTQCQLVAALNAGLLVGDYHHPPFQHTPLFTHPLSCTLSLPPPPFITLPNNNTTIPP